MLDEFAKEKILLGSFLLCSLQLTGISTKYFLDFSEYH